MAPSCSAVVVLRPAGLGWPVNNRDVSSETERYPLLYAPDRWEWAEIDVEFSTQLPSDELVQSVHVAGFIGEGVVLCRDERPDVWFLLGGTREPHESVDDCIRRELSEEAGGRLVGDFHPLGAHVGVSDRPHPYRPHLPHPRKAWLWGWSKVALVETPTLRAGGEAVTEVCTVPLREAMQLACTDNAWGGEHRLRARSLEQ